MALFKVLRGSRTRLDTQEKIDGHAYFCPDDGSFHIDYEDDSGVVQRQQLNAKNAETLTGKTFDQIKEEILAAIPESDIDTSDFVSKNSPVVKDTFTIEDEGYNNVIRFYPDGQIQIPYHGGGGFDSWYCFAEDEIEDDSGGTIATREWVTANAPSVDTSNFATLSGYNEFSNSIAAPEFTTTMNDEYKYATYYPNHIYYVDDSEGMAYSSELIFPTSEVGTIATREWVQANAPSIDTSNLVTKNDTVLTLKDSDTYEQGWLSIDASDGRISYNPYPGAFWSPTIILDMSTADPSDQEKNATVTFNLPTKPDGTYTLATTDMIGDSSGSNYVELGTRPTTYLSANPSQTIYTDINIGDSEASGYASYNLTTWGWYGGYIKLNPGSPAIEVQTPMASTSRSFQFPETGGILATQNWVTAQIQSQITDAIVNGEW